LRLTARGGDEDQLQKEVDHYFDSLRPLIGEIITGFESDRPIEAQIGDLLIEKQSSIAVAESCTGGRVAALFSSIPGASAYFYGGVVAYKTETKQDVLGVSDDLIKTHTVVSEEVALEMAKGVRDRMKSTYAIATTGNAGPTKGDSDAEVGTVVIALIGPDLNVLNALPLARTEKRPFRKP
jgi:nicotinamide-nucleotide amidase